MADVVPDQADVIGALEDAIMLRCEAAAGDLVQAVQSLPGDWDDEMFSRLAAAVPGVFVIFSGGQRSSGAGQQEAAIDGRWSVLVCTGHASGETARRRGDALEVGAYQLVNRLAAQLHGFTVPGVGTLSLLGVNNLFTGTVDKKGLAVYALDFSLPMTFELGAPLDAPGHFVTFSARYDTPPHTPDNHRAWLRGEQQPPAPDAEDIVTLP